MRVASHVKPWWYTIRTVTPCDILNRDGHVKDVTTTHVGYANDTVSVKCDCGGEWIGSTYAKPKRKRK
jgi:hypothetical protein